jgi:predicted phage terminase large subunit-like protein
MNYLTEALTDDQILSLTEAEWEEYEKLMQLEAAYQNFRDFISLTMPGYTFNWHHEYLIERLNRLTHEENQRLMVFMPPRHGKSELVSRRFPAFYLGRNRNARIIATSYSAALATTFNRDVQRILESQVYNDIFPDTLIPNTPLSKEHPDNNKYKRQASFFEIIDSHGHLMSTGVGGPITGLGADLAIIDDPVKNEEEATSETMREALFGWYNSTLYTRLEGGANLLVCQTRWHKGDLSGKLLEEMELGGEKWEVINFPALAVHDKPTKSDPRKRGEALWPGKYSEDRLNIIKKQVGTRVWSSLYQQNPVIEGGNIIKEEWFQYYHKLPFDTRDWRQAYMVTSWDLSFKKTGKSYVVGVVVAKYKGQFFLVDMWRRKADIVETKAAIKQFSEKYPACKTVLIEGKANGPAIVQMLKKEVSNLIEVNPTASKDERLHSVAPIFEAGNVLIPANSPMSKLVVDELCSFPNADNDDIVDAISQALNRFMEMRGLRHLRAMTKF